MISLVQVNVKRCVMGSDDNVSIENGDSSRLTKPSRPLVRKSKLVVVDLAGSERIQKSGGYPTCDLLPVFHILYPVGNVVFVALCILYSFMKCMCALLKVNFLICFSYL